MHLIRRHFQPACKHWLHCLKRLQVQFALFTLTVFISLHLFLQHASPPFLPILGRWKSIHADLNLLASADHTSTLHKTASSLPNFIQQCPWWHSIRTFPKQAPPPSLRFSNENVVAERHEESLEEIARSFRVTALIEKGMAAEARRLGRVMILEEGVRSKRRGSSWQTIR
jgi:hypothetical protein